MASSKPKNNAEATQTTLQLPDCPFLGLKNDPRTSLAYATTANHCFHCQTPAIPTLEHQDGFCLSKNYPECSVYQQAETLEFPKQLRQTVTRLKKESSPWRLVGPLIGLLVAGIVLWQFYAAYIARQALAEQNAQATVDALLQPTSMPTMPPQPTAAPTSVIATETAMPTPTDAPPQKHALETAINVDGKTFMIHMVIAGEQMVLLARDYQTSIEAIQAINYQLPQTVWSGSALVLMPGVQSIDPALPSFFAFKVTDSEIKIEALAGILHVEPALLKHYNRCEDDCLLSSGDWVIVPVAK